MMILSLAALTAIATQAPSDSTGTVAQLEACRAIARDAERLACFDRAAAAFSDARAKKDVVVMDRAEVRRTKRGLFGFSLPSLNLFGGDDDDAVKQLDAKVASASPAGVGFYQLTLDDGSTWETLERRPALNPKPGQPITIKRGHLGYRATWKSIIVPIRRVR